MADIFIPTLHTFENGNIFTGSCGLLRFRIVPQVTQTANKKGVIPEESFMSVEFWHGILCYELSQMEGAQTFPMTPEGRADMKAWLESQVQEA